MTHLPFFKELYLKRFMNNDWGEGANRNDKCFLKIKKDVFLEEFPVYANLLDGKNEGEEEEEEEGEEDTYTSNEMLMRRKMTMLKRSQLLDLFC